MPFWQRCPNLPWLARLRNESNERKERKEKSWEWETLTKTIPHLLVKNVTAEWPLLVSLGSQYACNIPLSLVVLHLHWFQSFYDLNYTTDEICLPYFSCTVPGFNQNGVYIGNPHYFNELLFLKMEQNIEKESVFTTYHNTSGIQSESSKYETDTSATRSNPDSDEKSPSYCYDRFFSLHFFSSTYVSSTYLFFDFPTLFPFTTGRGCSLLLFSYHLGPLSPPIGSLMPIT